MKTMKHAKNELAGALAALQAALQAEEPDEIAANIATAGSGIAVAIKVMDGQFRGFRRDVEVAARKLEARTLG